MYKKYCMKWCNPGDPFLILAFYTCNNTIKYYKKCVLACLQQFNIDCEKKYYMNVITSRFIKYCLYTKKILLK